MLLQGRQQHRQNYKTGKHVNKLLTSKTDFEAKGVQLHIISEKIPFKATVIATVFQIVVIQKYFI